MSRGQVADALKSDGRTGSGPGRQRLRRALVVAEIALAMPLLVAALLSVRSVTRYLADWQGYDPNGVLMFKLALPDARYADAESRRQFAGASIDALNAVPGVSGAALANVLPAGDSNHSRRVEIRRPADRRGHAGAGGGLPHRERRLFRRAAHAARRRARLHDRAIATTRRRSSSSASRWRRSYWPEGRAIGSQVRLGSEPWATVVGICGDVIHDWFDRRNSPTLYRPATQALDDRLMMRGAHDRRAAGRRRRRAPRARAGRSDAADLRRHADAPGAQREDDRAAVCRRRDGQLRDARAGPGDARPLRRDELPRGAARARDRGADGARRDEGRRHPASRSGRRRG